MAKRRPAPALPNALLAAALLLAGACGSSSEPHNGVQSVAINAVVDGSVSGTATNEYEIRPGQQPIQFVVLFQVISGSAVLDLALQPGTHLFTLNQSTPGEPLGKHSTPLFTSIANGVYRVSVHGEGQYRFEVYSSLPSPEHAPANFSIGDTVATEDLLAANDVDVFHFTGAAGDELIGYLMAGQPGPGELHLTVTGPGTETTVLAAVSSTGSQPFELDATPRFLLPAAGSYSVTLATAAPQSGIQDFSGPYRFQIRRIVRAPEHATVALVPNVALTGEGLDYIGDIDEFTLSGAPSDVYILRFQVTNGEPAAFLLEATGTILPSPNNPGGPVEVRSRGTDTALTAQSSFRFHPPASGHGTVRVSAVNQPGSGLPLSRGSYVIRADRINLAPEVASPVLSVGGSVVTEGMDLSGDIDEYTVTLTTPDTVNILLQLDSATFVRRTGPTLLTAEQFTLTGEPRGATSAPAFGSPREQSSGTFVMQPGQYTMRVTDPFFGIPNYDSYSGPYRLFLNRIRSAPETAPGVIAIGDTVTDAIFPVGDVDKYSFAGQQGDVIDFQIQGLGAASASGFGYQLFAPKSQHVFDFFAFGLVPTSSAHLSDTRTGRITLPLTGTYRIVILPNNDGHIPVEQGPYRFALLRLGTTPEIHGSALAVGDIVSDETLDSPDDVDEFTLHGLPGAEVAVFVRTVGVLPGVLLEAVVSTTRDTIRTAIGSEGTTGRFRIPASGSLLLRVSDMNHTTGAYRFQIVPINRAPEQTPAAYALGTIAPDETIDANGADVDEYQFTGIAGQKVVGYLQTPSGVGFPGVVMEILSAGTLQVLGSVIINNPTAQLQDSATAVITLPLSGQYVIRVRGVSDRGSVGVYRFLVQIVP